MPLRTIETTAPVQFLSFSPDNAYLAVSRNTSAPEKVCVFETGTGRAIWEWKYPECLETSLGNLVWPWTPLADPTWSGDDQWKLNGNYGRPEGWPGTTGAVFAPGETKLAVVHNASLSNSHVIVKHGGSSVDIKPGVWLLGGYVHFFDGEKLTYDTTLETEVPQQRPLTETIMHGLADVSVLRFSPDGEVATASTEGTLTLWSSEQGAGGSRVRAEGTEAAPRNVRWMEFSPDGQALATIGDSGVVKLWSVPGLRLLTEMAGHTAPGRWVCFSPDGSRLVSAALDGTMRVWDLATGDCERDTGYAGEIGGTPYFAFGDDLHSIFFACGNTLGVFDPYRGKATMRMSVDLTGITALTRSPNGGLLAAGDATGRIGIWELKLGLAPVVPPG